MTDADSKIAWWCSASLRISHPSLNPGEVSRILDATPEFADMPGQSKVPYGKTSTGYSCKSAGYWCMTHRVECPDRPDALFTWIEEFVVDRESQLTQMLRDEYDVNIYIGIHSNVMTVGFELPETPTLQSLSIPIGIEFYS